MSTRMVQIRCLCGGHDRDVTLFPGTYRLRCPMRGYFTVHVRKESDFAWNIQVHFSGRKIEEQNRLFLP